MTPLTRIALYVRDIPKISAFYQEHFGFVPEAEESGYVELRQHSGACGLVLLQASKGHRIGQSCVKLVFDVPDVAAHKKSAATAGLKFGAIHRGDGYAFANACDPAKNLIQISSRIFKTSRI